MLKEIVRRSFNVWWSGRWDRQVSVLALGEEKDKSWKVLCSYLATRLLKWVAQRLWTHLGVQCELCLFFFPFPFFFVWKASQFRRADCVGCRKCFWRVTIRMLLHLSGKEMSSGHLAPRLRLSAPPPGAHFRLRTERPWCTKTTDLIMWVHRKVSEHCCANQVSGHRLEAGQMLGKGQWGYVILIRRGLARRGGVGVCESRLLPWRHLAKVKPAIRVSPLALSQSVFPPSLTRRLRLSSAFTRATQNPMCPPHSTSARFLFLSIICPHAAVSGQMIV